MYLSKKKKRILQINYMKHFTTTTSRSISMHILKGWWLVLAYNFVNVCVCMHLTWRHWAPPRPAPQTGELSGFASWDCCGIRLQPDSDSRGEKDRRRSKGQRFIIVFKLLVGCSRHNVDYPLPLWKYPNRIKRVVSYCGQLVMYHSYIVYYHVQEASYYRAH